jgi:hypothetical protein
MGKEKGAVYEIVNSTLPPFARIYSIKQWKLKVRIAGVVAEITTTHLRNTSYVWYDFKHAWWQL